MIPEFIETDPSVRQFERYVRRFYGEEELLCGSLLTERVRMLVCVRYNRARLMGIQEDLALGIAILAAEIDAVRSVMDALDDAFPASVAFDRQAGERDLVHGATDRVARFLRRQFAPPVIFRVFGWLNRNPVRGRSRQDYSREITNLLAAWPDPATSAIN